MRVPEITDDPLQPADAAWRELSSQTVPLVPVPLESQPNEYIRTAWEGRPYGRVGEVQVAAARHGERLFVRLEWADAAEPNTEFPDGAGVFFPDSADDGPPVTIGSRAAPVRLWAWRDRLVVQQDLPAVRDLVASGPGVFQPVGPRPEPDPDERPGGPSEVSTGWALADGRWAVVVSGNVGAAASGRMGVVVWDGSNEERAGIGAVTPSWVPLAVA